jgi:ATP-dependent Lon protease
MNQNNNSTIPRSVVNAEVSAKLDQVNSWLEERAAAQDALERVRKENEEARLLEANRKVDELERELKSLRTGSVLQDIKQERESDLQRDLQKSVRDNVVLQENFQKVKQELAEHKAKLSNERRKYQTL